MLEAGYRDVGDKSVHMFGGKGLEGLAKGNCLWVVLEMGLVWCMAFSCRFCFYRCDIFFLQSLLAFRASNGGLLALYISYSRIL